MFACSQDMGRALGFETDDALGNICRTLDQQKRSLEIPVTLRVWRLLSARECGNDP